MNYKFKIGDKVKVVKGKFGCHPDDIGEITYIAGYGTYEIEPAYLIDPPLHGNAQRGFMDGMAAEKSFELVDGIRDSAKIGAQYHVDMSIQIAGGIHLSPHHFLPTMDYPEFLTDPKPKEKEIKPVFISVPKI